MYTPREVAAWLGVAPVTLRKWAIEFRPWLSPYATQVSRGIARRYADADLLVLSQARAYLARNFTYTEVQSFLAQKMSAATVTTDAHCTLAEPLMPAVSLPAPSDPAELAAGLAVMSKGEAHELSSILE
jgi:DNA-binding transcriptional MerR regulator